MMTVKELKAKLAEFPDATPIVLSTDAEGNAHSPLNSVSDEWYEPENRWSGFLVVDEDDTSSRAYRAVVLWPTN